MGRLSHELRDPWGLLISGVSGGLVWAVAGAAATAPVALPLGIAAGAAVLGVKVLTGLLRSGAEPEPVRERELPRPPRGSAGAYWLDRAEGAVQQLEALARTARPSPLGGQVEAAVSDAGDTLQALSRLGAQTAALDSAVRRVVTGDLDGEAQRLEQTARRGGSPAMLAEVARSAAAVRDRIAVRDRLQSARATLVARMEAVTLGLEGLLARLAEVLALAGTSGGLDDPVSAIAGLAGELEGLRVGLAETEALSRGALDAEPGPS